MVIQGFVYVANTEAYVAEALFSVRSLRRHMPSASVSLIAPRGLWNQVDGFFDHLIEPTLPDMTPIVKNDAHLAPYERVAFIDTDTYFTADYMECFRVLERNDLALAHEPARGWDYPTDVPRAFCELNTGVILFNNNAKVKAFFTAWLERYRHLLAKHQFRADQNSFRETLWESNEIRFCVLPTEFHAIIGKPLALAWEARLLHGRGSLEQAHRLLNQRIGFRAYMPGIGCLISFRGRKALLFDVIRLLGGYVLGFLYPDRLCNTEFSGMKKPHNWFAGEEP